MSFGCILFAPWTAAGAVTASVDYLVVGDWGQQADFTDMVGVASVMDKWAGSTNPQAILAVGDNFYMGGNYSYNGVTGTNDTKFENLWSNVYNGEHLRNLPWWLVLGNHDWYTPNSYKYELEFRGKTTWNMDDFFYTRRVQISATVAATLVFLETDLLQYGYAGDGYMAPGMLNNFVQLGWTAENYTVEKQLAWLDNTLATANNDSYIIVFGHHGPFACSWDHDHSQHMDELNALLNKWDVTAYIHGHHHTLAYYYVNSNKTVQIQVGASGNEQPVCAPVNASAPGNQLGNSYGFMHMRLDEVDVSFSFVTESDTVAFEARMVPRDPVRGVFPNTTFLTMPDDPAVHFPKEVLTTTVTTSASVFSVTSSSFRVLANTTETKRATATYTSTPSSASTMRATISIFANSTSTSTSILSSSGTVTTSMTSVTTASTPQVHPKSDATTETGFSTSPSISQAVAEMPSNAVPGQQSSVSWNPYGANLIQTSGGSKKKLLVGVSVGVSIGLYYLFS